MTSKNLLSSTILSAVLVSGATGSEALAEAAKVEGTIIRLEECTERQDPACMMELFAEDSTYLGPRGDGRVVKGKAAIQKVQEAMMKEVKAASEGKETKGPRKRFTVQSVRQIDDRHTVVDCSVNSGAGETSGKDAQSWHVTAIMVLTDGKWLFRDVRTFVVDHTPLGAAPAVPTLGTNATPPAPPPAADPPAAAPPAPNAAPN